METKFIEMGWYDLNGLFISNIKGEPLGDYWICNKEHYESIFKKEDWQGAFYKGIYIPKD